MKTYAAALFLFLIAPSTMALAGDNHMTAPWFSRHDFTTIEVNVIDYTNTPFIRTKTIRIDDPLAVKNLVQRIEQLTANGLEKISFKPKEVIELVFGSGKDGQVVQIYDGHFKTPSTGFNTSAEDKKKEDVIYKNILSLFNPKLNESLFIIKDYEYKLPDFTVIYKGKEHFDRAPVTVSGQDDFYAIKSKEDEQKAVISSGQLPAKPYPFTVNQKSYVLQTYRTSQGDVLPPNTFMVEEAR